MRRVDVVLSVCSGPAQHDDVSWAHGDLYSEAYSVAVPDNLTADEDIAAAAILAFIDRLLQGPEEEI